MTCPRVIVPLPVFVLEQRQVERDETWRADLDRLRRRRSVAQGAVRSQSVVMLPPLLDEYLGFVQGVEDLPVQQLIS
jgi:hypothetical protein